MAWIVKEFSFRRCRQHDHRTSAPKVRFPLLRLSGPTLGDIVKSCVSGRILVGTAGKELDNQRAEIVRFIIPAKPGRSLSLFPPLITPLPLAEFSLALSTRSDSFKLRL